MWYKKENKIWLIANKIVFPDGKVLSENHEDSIDGWFWSDDEPQEYTKWIEEIKRLTVD